MSVPSIDSFFPAAAPVHAPVSIEGAGFTGTTSVKFGSGQRAASFTVLSDTQMIAWVPAGAQNGAIVVLTPGGWANTGGTGADFIVAGGGVGVGLPAFALAGTSIGTIYDPTLAVPVGKLSVPFDLYVGIELGSGSPITKVTVQVNEVSRDGGAARLVEQSIAALAPALTGGFITTLAAGAFARSLNVKADHGGIAGDRVSLFGVAK